MLACRTTLIAVGIAGSCWCGGALAQDRDLGRLYPLSSPTFAAATVPPAGMLGASQAAWMAYRIPAGILDAEFLRDWHAATPQGAEDETFGIGYAWRNMRLEGGVTSYRRQPEFQPQIGPARVVQATAGRLAYHMTPELTLQLTRRTINLQGLPDVSDDVRRTSVALSYDRPFGRSRWQTIVAFGRSGAKADGQVANAYLFETALHVDHAHTVFSRFERASADELFCDRDALHGQNFNASRMSLGYMYAVPMTGKSQLAFGGLVARRTMPEQATAVLGDERPNYKLFMRMSLQLP